MEQWVIVYIKYNTFDSQEPKIIIINGKNVRNKGKKTKLWNRLSPNPDHFKKIPMRIFQKYPMFKMA